MAGKRSDRLLDQHVLIDHEAAEYRQAGTADPARFRANILIDGAPAWAEKTWEGKRLTLGGATLQGVRPIGRCAATEVDPDTAERDINLPLTLRRGFGHIDCGLYADVVEGGSIAVGDALVVAD